MAFTSTIGKGVPEFKVKSGARKQKASQNKRAIDFINLMLQKGRKADGCIHLVGNDGCYPVARVGEHSITNADILTDIRFIFFVAGKKYNKELAKQMVFPLLHAKIGEELRTCLANRADISVTDRDIDDRIQQLATWNGISKAELEARIRECGIGWNAFRQWVRTQLLSQNVDRILVGEIEVSAEEIARAKAKYAREIKEKRYKVAEISLPSGEAAQNVKKLLDGGFSFLVLAQAMSQSGRSKLGEDWTSKSMIDPNTWKALERMEPGEYIGPIAENGDGVKFIYMVDIADPGFKGKSSGSYVVLRTVLRQGGAVFAADAKHFETILIALSNVSSAEEYRAICKQMNIECNEVVLKNPTEQEAAMAANSKASGHPCIAPSAIDQNSINVIMYVKTQCEVAKVPDDEIIKASVAEKKFDDIAKSRIQEYKKHICVMIDLEALQNVV
ncbi:MAG: hypothetical protein LBD43_00635 [Holosporales bacterium]|nr:hypothetical protein [Holosporales bacterium]